MGQGYRSSSARTFSNYELFLDDTTKGVLGPSYTVGQRTLWYDNVNYNTKVEAVVIDSDGTVREDIYIVDPELGWDSISAYNLQNGIAGELLGYLTIDPNAANVTDDLRSLIAGSTAAELKSLGYMVSADDATAEQKLNPAIYEGYRYVVSSMDMPINTSQTSEVVRHLEWTVENVPTSSGAETSDGITAGTWTMYANVGNEDPVNKAVVAVPYYHQSMTGTNVMWLTIDNNDPSMTYTLGSANPAVRIAGVGSIRLTNPYTTPTDANHLYIEKGGVQVNYVDADGNTIADTEVLYEHEDSTTSYDTTAVRPETITVDGVTYYYREVLDVDDPATDEDETSVYTDGDTVISGETITRQKDTEEEQGTVEAGTLTNVTYVYDVKGEVLIDYKILGTDTSIRDTYTDTAMTWVTKDDGTTVTYDATEDGERPAVIVVTDDEDVTHTYRLVDNSSTTSVIVNGEPVSDGLSGNLVPGTTNVTYYYTEVTGSVVVDYKLIDADGNKTDTILQPRYTDTNAGTPVGTAYDTTEDGEMPETITTVDNKGVTHTYRLVADATEGDTTGEVVEGETVITYYYKEVVGDVIVHYVDEDDNPIADDKTDEDDAPVDSEYDTTDNKPHSIQTPEGKTYVIVPEKTQGNETGTVTEGTTEVTYVYKEVKGAVVIHYVDEDGNTIAEDVTDTEYTSTGTPYDTTEDGEKPETITTSDGKVYTLVPAKSYSEYNGDQTGLGNTIVESGTVEVGLTEVTYVYRLTSGSVVINYVDEDGNPIKDPVVDTPEGTPEGTPYDTTEDGEKPERIVTEDGKTYEFKEVDPSSDPETGTVTPGETEVTYVYTEVTGSVVVDYKILGTDTTLLDRYTDTPAGTSTGVAYDTAENSTEKPTIIVKDGKTYRLVESATDGNETGTVVEGETVITYYYEELVGDVVIHYVDEDGNPIADDVTDTPAGTPVGTPYDTTEDGEKPQRITKDGKTYELVPEKTQGNETGTVTEGTTEVTYVYKEVTGSVVVHYVDEDGNVIATPVTDTPEGTSTGTPYDTTDYKPTTITKDGKTYELVKVKDGDGETGEVVEGQTDVTYIYRLVKDETPGNTDDGGNTPSNGGGTSNNGGSSTRSTSTASSTSTTSKGTMPKTGDSASVAWMVVAAVAVCALIAGVVVRVRSKRESER